MYVINIKMLIVFVSMGNIWPRLWSERDGHRSQAEHSLRWSGLLECTQCFGTGAKRGLLWYTHHGFLP